MRDVSGRAVGRKLFPTWQPRYAERGIATFPVRTDKVPGVKGWRKLGLRLSTELAEKFTDADTFGYQTGRPSNVTVHDIDTADERVGEDAIRRHGQPAIVVRTASGKFHHLYRYNGERRRLRPWGKRASNRPIGRQRLCARGPEQARKGLL